MSVRHVWAALLVWGAALAVPAGAAEAPPQEPAAPSLRGPAGRPGRRPWVLLTAALMAAGAAGALRCAERGRPKRDEPDGPGGPASFDQVEALHRLAARLGGELSFAQVAQVAFEEIAATVKPDLSVMSPREGEPLLLHRVHAESPSLQSGRDDIRKVARCLCDRAAALGKPVYSRDVPHDPRCAGGDCRQAGIQSLAALPLHHAGEDLGVLAMTSVAERDFQPEATFLETLADQVAAALHSCLLRERAQADARELRDRLADLEQTEKALREEHTFRAGIIGRATEGLCVCHNVNRFPFVEFTVWNDRMAEITGYTMDQINRLGWYQSLYPDPDTQQRARQRMARMREGDDLRGEQWEITRADGQCRTVRISTSLLETADGMAHVLAMMDDVTERKGAEKALRNVTARYEAILAAVPDIIMEVDKGHRYTWANRAGLEFFGPDVIGREASEFFDGEQGVYGRVRPLFDGAEETVHVESWQRRHDGEKRLLAWWCRVLKDSDGNVTGALSTARDITDPRKSEEMIEDLARFPAESPSPVLRVSPEGVILHANPASAPLLKQWRAGVGQAVSDELAGEIKAAVAAGSTREVDIECGQEVYSFVVAPVPQGGQVNLYGRNVTDRRQLEDQLRQSQKMESVGRLAGGIAHDFNNQLTVVAGYCDLLLQKPPEDEAIRQALEEIRQASRRAQRLTSQLLAFSRRQVLKPEVLNLNDVLGEMQNPLARMIGEDIRLAVRTDGHLDNVQVDRSQFEQAIMNLAVNARDAMAGGGQLTIETANAHLTEEYTRTHLDAKPGPHVLVAITDTGTGMDAPTLQRVFEPFFTTKEVGKGTGLGLSMVYGFVKQSGGLISVYSELGHGTCFRIYLPRVEMPVEPPPPPAHEQMLQGTETVLVVEDDEAVRRIIVLALRGHGYTVLEASNARECLPIGEHYQGLIDLLITDVIMPSMHGPELARRLTALRPTMKVLFVTGYTQTTVVDHGMLGSGADVLVKPFGPEALARRVRQVLDVGAKSER